MLLSIELSKGTPTPFALKHGVNCGAKAVIKSYKYRTGPAALRSLSEGSLYFAPPSTLNDILEVKFDLADSSEYLSTMSEAWNLLALQRGITQKYEFSQPTPTELDISIKNENEIFRNACNNVGIFASSIRPDNQPLWAYYANEFKGVCFELEWSKEVLEKNQIIYSSAIYSNEQRIHNRALDAKQCLLEIGASNPKWSIPQIKAYSLTEQFRRRWALMTTARAVSVKHSDWSHEQEIRFISSKPGGLPILHLTLKRIYYVSSDFPEWISIMRLACQLYPEAELVKLNFNHKDPLVTEEKIEVKRVPVSEI